MTLLLLLLLLGTLTFTYLHTDSYKLVFKLYISPVRFVVQWYCSVYGFHLFEVNKHSIHALYRLTRDTKTVNLVQFQRFIQSLRDIDRTPQHLITTCSTKKGIMKTGCTMSAVSMLLQLVRRVYVRLIPASSVFSFFRMFT